MNVRHTHRRGNALLILFAFCLAIALACVGMYFLMASKPAESPSPAPLQAAPTSAPEPTVFDPLPVVKERTAKAISNGAKAELIGSWEGTPPVWVPESPSSVKLTLKHGQQSMELAWKIENGEAKPANKLAEQLEAWVPGKNEAVPAFLVSQQPQVVEETTSAAPPQQAPATASQPSTRNESPSTAWRDDGDPSQITNADLPPAAFAPKKPRAEKTGKPSTKPEMGSAGNLRLMGVMDGDGGTRAIINQGGEYVEVKVGENVGSYRVQSINGKEVVLDKNGSRVRVSSDTGSNAAGGPPPRPEKPQPPPRPEMPMRPSTSIDQDLEVPPIEEPVFDPGPFDDGK